MLGLPSSTQIRRVISRKMVFDHFGAELSAERRKKIEAEIDRYKESDLPAIILIPGVSGNTGRGMTAVKKSVEQAVGSDIIFTD